MNSRVLFVDDEPNVLNGIRRQLDERYDLVTAVGPEEGLEALSSGPFQVVVSDMRMPNMDGAEFLARVKTHDSDAVRMILSGQSDMEMTIAAVNNGGIFRFLSKPCDTDDLVIALDLGLEQHRLVTAERELLEETIGGAVRLLMDVLAMTSPTAFSRTSATQRIMEQIVANLDTPLLWEWRMACMLSFIGCLSLSDETVKKAFSGQALDEDEQRAFEAHPLAGQQLLVSIPRFESVAAIIGAQATTPNLGELGDFEEWDATTLGSQCLRAASLYGQCLAAGSSRGEVFTTLRESGGLHAQVLAAVARVRVDSGARVVVTVADLRPGMVLDEDLLGGSGNLLLAEGYVVTEAIIVRLRNHASRGDVREPFRVRADDRPNEL